MDFCMNKKSFAYSEDMDIEKIKLIPWAANKRNKFNMELLQQLILNDTFNISDFYYLIARLAEVVDNKAFFQNI